MALQVTQVKSSNGAKHNQLATLETLGLRRIRHTVVVPDRPEFRGMVATVNHLVAVTEVADDKTLPSDASRPLTPADSGEPGVVGDEGGASAAAEELLDEQDLLGEGVDNPTDVVQNPRQAIPDDMIVKVPAGGLEDEDEDGDADPAPFEPLGADDEEE